MNAKIMTRLAVFAVAGSVLAGCASQQGTNTAVGTGVGTDTQITEQPDGSLKLNIPSSVTFDTNSYAIKPSFAPVLDQLAKTLQQNPEVIAQVVGHTDSTGQPAYNQTLSVNRAQSVVGFLEQRGVAPQRLSAQGMGQNQPIADNSTEASRAANRRVEIYLRATAQHTTQLSTRRSKDSAEESGVRGVKRAGPPRAGRVPGGAGRLARTGCCLPGGRQRRCQRRRTG
ncbi:MAG: Probable lipoprotein YiaD [uncultured Paraburkholderia sp.]|nr:MAG: Probable lipoprotein YiaD [uncultured Paraburkholderia sp.]